MNTLPSEITCSYVACGVMVRLSNGWVWTGVAFGGGQLLSSDIFFFLLFFLTEVKRECKVERGEFGLKNTSVALKQRAPRILMHRIKILGNEAGWVFKDKKAPDIQFW